MSYFTTNAPIIPRLTFSIAHLFITSKMGKCSISALLKPLTAHPPAAHTRQRLNFVGTRRQLANLLFVLAGVSSKWFPLLFTSRTIFLVFSCFLLHTPHHTPTNGLTTERLRSLLIKVLELLPCLSLLRLILSVSPAGRRKSTIVEGTLILIWQGSVGRDSSVTSSWDSVDNITISSSSTIFPSSYFSSFSTVL
jgi:hypothetical protein